MRRALWVGTWTTDDPVPFGFVEPDQAPHSCSLSRGQVLPYAGLALSGRPATHTPLVAGCTGYDTGVTDSHTPGCRPPSAGRTQLGGGIGAAPTNTITHIWDRNNGP